MVTYRVLSEEFDEVDYQLIAIHTTIEDFRLAYFINKNLIINLSKDPEDLSIHENNKEIYFSRFNFKDDENSISWDLIQNKSHDDQSSATLSTGLFADTISKVSTKTYLIPEFKTVDYFLKVDKEFTEQELIETIFKLKEIQNVSTVYSIDAEKIKSKNNLIF
ncbi:IPExxxVDY family protein [Flavobacterium sp.]